MESERNGLALGLKVVKIICALIAFVCSMIVGLSWQGKAVAFFNILQLVVMLYALVAIILHLTKMLNASWWKTDCIVSTVLACMEFAATSIWAQGMAQSGFSSNSLIALTVFGFLSGIVCILNVSYLVQMH